MKQSASDIERAGHLSKDANIVARNAPDSAAIRWQKEFAALQELRARYSPGDTRYSDEFLFWIDAPNSWPTSAQYQRLVGWCVGCDGRPPTHLRCKVGNRIFCAACVYDRPDVAQYLGLEELHLRCGFVLVLEMPSKTARLEIEVQSRDGCWARVFSTTVCGSPSRPEEPRLHEQWQLEESAARYVWWFDRPRNWVTHESRLYICGWCVDRTGDPIAGIRARLGRRIDARRLVSFSEDPLVTGLFFINHATFDPSRVDFKVPLGSIEEWTIRNASEELHTFHIHQLPFQIVSTNGRPMPFDGLRDTVDVPTGTP